MSFDVGSLVRARGREWVVLPDPGADTDVVMLRPLGGTDDEITGIYLPLERVEVASFSHPDPEADLGNHLSSRLLRDAARLGNRAAAGPFRSLARIGVEPRPYQLVPLIMALKLAPVRLLIADDVGIGKTVEACMVARELIDRGEVGRLAVLCPPHLAEQWQQALAEQFHLDAELVLPSTAPRLERKCRPGESLFERYPYTVVSTDYIKSERRRGEFLRTCPELVIVDEAHTCAAAPGRSAAQQRHQLLRDLVDPGEPRSAERHLLLVTATPHSGNEEAFRSLLALLSPELAGLPDDLSGEDNRKQREDLARYFVQRRRADLAAYLDTETPFPEREVAEISYQLTDPYRRFFDRVLAYCRETVVRKGEEGEKGGAGERGSRVRWWSALALLRALSSSPAAAAATLRNRSAAAQGETPEQVDEEGRRAVLDLDDEHVEGIDVAPGSESDVLDESEHRKLQRLAREAEALEGARDAKLAQAVDIVTKLVGDGHAPILFCRFIPTAHYVADALREKLSRRGVEVAAVTGLLAPEERERRVRELGEAERRVLVCTDCLSEGINLQQGFDAVMHYDLSWNPTRHEQREGRVDRYGQPRSTVRTLTYYGQDNPVDGIVLQVLLRKHRAIRRRLGVIVPIPTETRLIEDAILEGLLLRETTTSSQLSFDFLEPLHEKVDLEWDAAADREKRSRTLFAQNQLLRAVNETVRTELEDVRRAIGGQADVRRFVIDALTLQGALVDGPDAVRIDLRESPRRVREAVLGRRSAEVSTLDVRFGGAPHPDAELVTRTHPLVEGLAAQVLEGALDTEVEVSPARRCGAVRTDAVERRTTLLLLRLRFHIVTRGRDGADRPLLAEELVVAAFEGAPEAARWLSDDAAEALLDAEPDANLGADQARAHLERVIGSMAELAPHLEALAKARGEALFEAHHRVRKAVGSGVRALRVDPHLPPDVLGVYVLLPASAGGALADLGPGAGAAAGQRSRR